MQLKVNGQFLDYDGDLIVEKQAKLLQDMSLVTGDYTYDDVLPPTHKNLSILQLESSNIENTTIYNNVVCEVLNDAGEQVYIGALRVDSIVKNEIHFTFISGNSGWIQLLSPAPPPFQSEEDKLVFNNLLGLNLSQWEFETAFHYTGFSPAYPGECSHIIARMGAKHGIVYPLVDRGTLQTRGFRRLRVGDMQPFIYVKDVMNQIFLQNGLKLDGPLLLDPLYDSAIITGNSNSVVDFQKNNRKVFAGAVGGQSITDNATPPSPGSNTTTVIDLQTTGKVPGTANIFYYNSVNTNFNDSANTYNADIKCNLHIHGNLTITVAGDTFLSLWRNGVQVGIETTFPPIGSGLVTTVINFDFTVPILVELFASKGDSFTVNVRTVSNPGTIVQANIYFELTDIFYQFAASILKKMANSDFVGDIFRQFNVVTTYNYFNKTVTAELFKNIKNNPEIDISDFIDSIDQYYSEDVSGYGSLNYMQFLASGTDDVTKYNSLNATPWGAGTFNINNYYLDSVKDFISLNWAAPYVYFNPFIGCWLCELKYVALSVSDKLYVQNNPNQTTIVLITEPVPINNTGDNSTRPGTVEFVLPVDNNVLGSLMRVNVPGIPSYNYDWPTCAEGSSPLPQTVDATTVGQTNGGTLQYMKWDDADDEMIMLNFIPQQYVSSFSNYDGLYFGDDGASVKSPYYTIFDFAYFLPPPNMALQQTLAFGLPNGFSGISAIQSYYGDVVDILNQPNKMLVNCYLPEAVFRQIDQTRPIRIKTKEHNIKCYLNRVTGYKQSTETCVLELVKFA